MGFKKWSRLATLVVLAVVLRLVLSAISFHPDIQAFDFGAWVINQGYSGGLYDYLLRLPFNSPILQTFPVDFLIYPPLIYFYHSIFWFIFNHLLGMPMKELYLFNVAKAFGDPGLNLHLLLLKIPYLFFDLGTAWLLTKFFENRRDQILAALLWLFNPVSIYATYLIGQFDIIPTFFMILALFVVVQNKHWWKMGSLTLAAVILGLGASFKISPLFLLIPLSSLTTSWGQRIKVISFGLLTYLVFLLPYLPSRGFRMSALVASQTLKSLYPQIMVSGGEGIMLFLVSILFFCFLFFQRKTENSNLWQRCLIILLLFFTFTHYHPQWFIWLTPFLIIELVKSNFKHLYLTVLALFSFFGLLFFFDPGLTLGLFAPIITSLHNAASLWQLLGLNLDYNFWRSILQTVFAAVSAFFIFQYFPRTSETRS